MMEGKFIGRRPLNEFLLSREIAVSDRRLRRMLSEGLDFGDLKGLVLSVVAIDRHEPKIDTEENVVVLAFTVLYEDSAIDLAEFIETGPFELLDVEVSPGPAIDGSYRVFVELIRDYELYSKIRNILEDVEQITGKDGDAWTFISMGVNDEKPLEFNRANFKKHIIDRSVGYRMNVIYPKEKREEAEREKKERKGRIP